MKNFEIIGYTKKNLSPIIRVGFADYGDFRNGIKFAASWDNGNFYRPVYVEEYFTVDTLPDSAKWVLRDFELSPTAQQIVNTINNEFSSQSKSLSDYIRISFNYYSKIYSMSIHNIDFPTEFKCDYWAMYNCLGLLKEKTELSNKLSDCQKRNTEISKVLTKIRETVFNKFYVGKLGKREYTRQNQMNNFFKTLLS